MNLESVNPPESSLSQREPGHKDSLGGPADRDPRTTEFKRHHDHRERASERGEVERLIPGTTPDDPCAEQIERRKRCSHDTIN